MIVAVVAGHLLVRLIDPIGWLLNIILYFFVKRHLPRRWISVVVTAVISALLIQSVMSAVVPFENPVRAFASGAAYSFITGLFETGIVALLSWRAFWNFLRPERRPGTGA
jgi:hypothetical protein